MGNQPFYLNTNVNTLSLVNNLNQTTSLLNTSLERLSTFKKINRASDGAAALSISNQLQAQIQGFDSVKTNIQSGSSLLGIAEAGVSVINEAVQSIRELGVQAANGTVTDFSAFQASLTNGINEINRVAASTQFNGKNLLDGSIGPTLNIQTGTGSGANDKLNIASALGNTNATSIGITQATVASNADAQTLITQADTALSNLGAKLANIGGFQNSLSSSLDYANTAQINLTASQQSLIGTDIASETARVSLFQLQQQSTAAVIAQANSQSSRVFSILFKSFE
ncbi:MAG: flagellin FliC [Cyanobacteria bacterium]|nr:flagellin FliC [Cyanobacteriota bacterium]